MKKVDKFIDANNWDEWVGKQIIKHSGKPFKSGPKSATPLSITMNPFSGKKAFKLLECGTVVDCYQCKLEENAMYN